MLEDLPILKVQERQLRNIIVSLEKKGILERISELKNEMHLNVDFDVLFGNKMPNNFNLSEIGFHDEGNGLLTIDYYDIKKIKIIHDNARVRELDQNQLLNLLNAYLKIYCGQIVYDAFIVDKLEIDEITDTYILFSIINLNVVAKTNGHKFKEAFDATIKELLMD